MWWADVAGALTADGRRLLSGPVREISDRSTCLPTEVLGFQSAVQHRETTSSDPGAVITASSDDRMQLPDRLHRNGYRTGTPAIRRWTPSAIPPSGGSAAAQRRPSGCRRSAGAARPCGGGNGDAGVSRIAATGVVR